MSSWQPLPDAVEPAVRQLTVRLRELKDATGLSLTALAHRTPASKSAWGRYLNGQALPPRQVVAALGELAGADRARLMALWELAAHAHRHPVAPAADDAPTEVEAVPEDVPPPRRRGVLSLATVVPTVLSTAALTVVVTLAWHPGFAPPAPQPSSTPPASPTGKATTDPGLQVAPPALPQAKATRNRTPVKRRSRLQGMEESYSESFESPTHRFPGAVPTGTSSASPPRDSPAPSSPTSKPR